MSNIVQLRPHDPIDWETFAKCPPPRPEPSKFSKAFIFLCALAVVVGTLWGFSH